MSLTVEKIEELFTDYQDATEAILKAVERLVECGDALRQGMIAFIVANDASEAGKNEGVGWTKGLVTRPSSGGKDYLYVECPLGCGKGNPHHIRELFGDTLMWCEHCEQLFYAKKMDDVFMWKLTGKGKEKP